MANVQSSKRQLWCTKQQVSDMNTISKCSCVAAFAAGPARDALAQTLTQEYVPVQLDHPGLRLLHSDPPIFAIDDFLSTQHCQAFIDTAVNSGKYGWRFSWLVPCSSPKLAKVKQRQAAAVVSQLNGLCAPAWC